MIPTAEIKVELDVKGRELQNTHIDWVFTDTYLSSLLIQYDKNRNDILDKKELLTIKEAMLDYLKENNMLTKMNFSKDNSVDEATQIKPIYDNIRLDVNDTILTFSYDIKKKLILNKGSLLSFSFVDEKEFFGFVVTDLVVNSDDLAYTQNLYLFTASIFFETPSLNIVDTNKSIPPTILKVKNTPQELEEESLQSNLLQESISKIKSLFESIKDETNPLAYLSLLLFAYIYGLVHALGPGHGKTLVASYFLSNERSYLKALWVSLSIGIVHTFSAFLLTLLIYFSVNTFLSQFMQDTVYITTKVSAITIISIALYLFYKKYKAYKQITASKKFNFSTSAHLSTCGCGSCKVDKNSTDFALIVSAGIIPCPGTISIFILSLSLGLYYAGFIAAFVMSLGMSSIIFISAIISVLVRKKTSNTNEKLKKYFEYGSLFIILVLGLLLLVS